MKKPPSTILAMAIIAACTLFAAGTVFAQPQPLSESSMATISGESGIDNGNGNGNAILAYTERDTEVNREILRRNNATDYPVESTDRILTHFTNIEAGKASGQTIHQLMDEATPGRLPQFFIDEAQREVNR